jgi:hypothetical protein
VQARAELKIRALGHCDFASHNFFGQAAAFNLFEQSSCLDTKMLAQFSRNRTVITHFLPRLSSVIPSRHYAIVPPSTPNPEAAGFQVFHRDAKRMQKDRAAAKIAESRVVDYLKDEIAARVADRLLVVNLINESNPFINEVLKHTLFHRTSNGTSKRS